jgi:hypothetical protein
MGKRLLFSFLIISPTLLFASQAPTEWRRVYTSSESITEIDHSSVTFTANNVNHQINFGATRTGRVNFRTIFSKPQLLDKKSSVSYKTSLETYEFRCDKDDRVIQNQTQPDIARLKPIAYRLYEAIFLNSDHHIIRHHQISSDWKPIRDGNVMDKLGQAACALIEEKKRTP